MNTKLSLILILTMLFAVFSCSAAADTATPVVMSENLTLENVRYGLFMGENEYNPESVGSLLVDGTVVGPADVVRVRIATWLDYQPTSEEARQKAEYMVSIWQDKEESLSWQKLPFSLKNRRPIHEEELGKTEYIILAALDSNVNLIGYAVTKVDIPSREQLFPADLNLPVSLTTIESEAFAGGTYESVYIPANVTSISENAFGDRTNLTVYGLSGSYAESYARENNFTFIPVN